MAHLRMKIVGRRGRWLADAGGEALPVLHGNWRVPPDRYRDPMDGVDADGAKYVEYVAALRAGDRAIIQRDAGPDDLSRAGYVGVFRYADLEIGEDHSIALRLTERIASPRR